MTNWGITTIGGTAYNLSDIRAMSEISPNIANMVLQSISIYCGALHNNQIRVALYQGGSAESPVDATLIEDLGQTAGSGTTEWVVVASGINPAIPANTRIWIAFKGDDGGFTLQSSSDSGDAGNFRADVGRWSGTGPSENEASGFAATWPADSGSFGSFWYSIYLTYETPSGIVVLRRRRM